MCVEGSSRRQWTSTSSKLSVLSRPLLITWPERSRRKDRSPSLWPSRCPRASQCRAAFWPTRSLTCMETGGRSHICPGPYSTSCFGTVAQSMHDFQVCNICTPLTWLASVGRTCTLKNMTFRIQMASSCCKSCGPPTGVAAAAITVTIAQTSLLTGLHTHEHWCCCHGQHAPCQVPQAQ